jgi:hypothetical protein
MHRQSKDFFVAWVLPKDLGQLATFEGCACFKPSSVDV